MTAQTSLVEQEVTRIVTEGLRLVCWYRKTDTFICPRLIEGHSYSCVPCLIDQILALIKKGES